MSDGYEHKYLIIDLGTLTIHNLELVVRCGLGRQRCLVFANCFGQFELFLSLARAVLIKFYFLVAMLVNCLGAIWTFSRLFKYLHDLRV